MDYSRANEVLPKVATHESDLRHQLCFGDGANPFEQVEPDEAYLLDTIEDYLVEHLIVGDQVEALAWWTSFKGSRYYHCRHNYVASLIRKAYQAVKEMMN